jgi:hypothetical protein
MTLPTGLIYHLTACPAVLFVSGTSRRRRSPQSTQQNSTNPTTGVGCNLSQISYITTTGNHVATVMTDLSSVDSSAVDGSSNVQTCG